MARTGSQRLDGTLTYIDQHIDSQLATAVRGAINHLSADAVGAELSLEGYKFGVFGSDNQHWALRALLLCHKAFLNAPYSVGAGGAPFSYNFLPDLPKTHYRSKSEEDIRRAIRCYLAIPGVSRDALAVAATSIRGPQGGTTWETLTRATDPFPSMPVCFDALKMWLFKAGFVSIRWLARTGPTMTAQTVNTMLGDGQEILENKLSAMPRGYLFNFHRKGDKAVCHWGVSLGNGRAAGSNTSANWPGAKSPVNFFLGDSHYGEFLMAESLEVCKHKYGELNKPAEVVIRQIDPEQVGTYF